MSQAKSILSRRNVVAALTTALAGTAAPALAGGNPDAELVRLGQEWQRACDYEETCSDADFKDAAPARHQIEAQILATPAAGLVGLAVKARVAAWYGNDEQVGLHADLIAEVQRLAKQSAAA